MRHETGHPHTVPLFWDSERKRQAESLKATIYDTANVGVAFTLWGGKKIGIVRYQLGSKFRVHP
jgi:hypothetical protein